MIRGRANSLYRTVRLWSLRWRAVRENRAQCREGYRQVTRCTASLSRCFKVYTGFWSLFSLSDPVCFGSGLSLSDCVILLWFLSDCVWSCCGLGQPSSRAASQSNVYLDTYGYCDNGQAYDTMSVDSSDSMETSISACSPDNVSW